MGIGFAIITCSDTRTIEEDTAGAALRALIEAQGWEVLSHAVVPDDRARIVEAIVQATDGLEADIVLTCGGTGLSPRDVTPEATKEACERDVPGIAEALRAYSLQKTPRAMLSRAVCRQRGSKVVINFPGSEKAAREHWEALEGQVEHIVAMSNGGGH